MCSTDKMNGTKICGLDNAAFQIEVTDLENRGSDSMVKEETNNRAQWGNSIEFLMSCIAMSVGLGNIWRFPFTAYENGGGAFLIPYIIVLTVIGRPLYYMEMALGQFSNRGNVKFYQSLSPVLKGVGYGQVIGSICVATYYCCLMAITLYYLVNSFTSSLPWGVCLEKWGEYLLKINRTCISASEKRNETIPGSISSSELFFRQEVLQESTDITEGIGVPEWKLSVCLGVAWLVTFLVTVKGVKSSGKASYFLAIFPYVIMLTLLARAVTLEGALEGMYYFIRTDWGKLGEPDVWYAAVTQCFFSLNVGFGSIIMLSSHNDFGHNINRDAMIVTTLDTFTSLLSGVTIFGILGNLAHNLGVTPDKVINSGGVGLAFISYPDAIAKFEALPWLFAILFFFMLFVLGIGSLVALHGTVNTVLQDLLPHIKGWKISFCTALCGFLIGLVYVTPGGQFMVNLVDFFGGTFIIFFFVIIEVCGVSWFYGLENFTLDVEYMLKSKVGVYWRFTWGLITPLLLCIIFLYFLAKLKRLFYGPYPYPDVILGIGWTILIFSVIQFLAWIIYSLYSNRKFGFSQMCTRTFTNEHWGPKGKNRYEEWKKFKEDSLRRNEFENKSWIKRKLQLLINY